MILHVVTSVDYGDFAVDSVWSTRELAEARRAELEAGEKRRRYRLYEHYVQSVELDQVPQ